MTKPDCLGSFSLKSAKRRNLPALISLAGFVSLLFLSGLPIITDSKSRNYEAEKADLQARMKRVHAVLAKKKREEMGIANAVRQVDQELDRTGRELDQKTRDLKRAQTQEAFYQKKLGGRPKSLSTTRASIRTG